MTLEFGEPASIVVPTVVTDRLILRCWRPADIDPYAAMNADEETMRYLNGPFDRAGTERLVTHLAGMWVLLGYGMWAVEDKATGEFLGRAGLYYADGWPGVEVAVSIRRDRWRQGLGTEAIRTALDYGFAALGEDELVTVTDQGNIGANGIARKLGMSFRKIATVGPWRDNNVYAISRETWAARTV
ncbi:GNAT family N-acetyltransferase [Protofrankia coriariae]|uniref:Acetyltransferase n=1 Tax=Protofrankia coriariae TaxID=1562887 RepID=A0ABR5EZS8_9ACTN|nr:GNAT family N-acetyltransferase [Protofrankia coriariae]KLL09983.1 acetyltransferase [Protofrankia coriariae]